MSDFLLDDMRARAAWGQLERRDQVAVVAEAIRLRERVKELEAQLRAKGDGR